MSVVWVDEPLAVPGREDTDAEADAGHVSQAMATGTLVALLEDGQVPLVRLHAPRDGPAVRARTAVDLDAAHIGSTLVMLRCDAASGDASPVVVGLVRCAAALAATAPSPLELCVDGRRTVLAATDELVLHCGKASLTLRADGSIEMVGERILTRATGPNRLQGGSVQLN